MQNKKHNLYSVLQKHLTETYKTYANDLTSCAYDIILLSIDRRSAARRISDKSRCSHGNYVYARVD